MHLIHRHLLDPSLIHDALLTINRDILSNGILPEHIKSYLSSANWFPHLREHKSIIALREALPDHLQEGTPCEPQILLQFPHVGKEPTLSFHQDKEPPWANGRKYTRIIGVPLSQWRASNGSPIMGSEHTTLLRHTNLDPGDILVMSGDQWHSGGVNRSADIRYGVYFRWLA
jgi:hypothetical protein